MAAVQVKDISMKTDPETGAVSYLPKSEWILGSSSDTSEIPDVAPGSVAYTADGTYIAVYDGTQWVQWGGAQGE